ncbi:Piwi domain-containing protein, partial [Rhizophagus diaphanus]
NTELYETIKRVMDTEIGCLSQCVSVDSRKNFRSPQYCANLAMKINLKLGGVNSILPEDKLRLPSGEEVLFLGADVTHPKDKNGKSICAVVGSLDNQAGRFITKYQDQERSGKEEILEIDKLIKEILREYCDYQKRRSRVKNNEVITLPPCIIMYRDGVSESQFERVLRWELPKIKEACRLFRQGYEPKIIFSVVGKRHHTRIFPVDPKNRMEADKNGNCLVGTIVDKKITHPTLNDFYLQSHFANQGTARPSHYTILHDDIKLTIDEFQGLSNTLCYNFQRSTSSVSIPAPTYYAHLTCARAKMYL